MVTDYFVCNNILHFDWETKVILHEGPYEYRP